MTRIAKGRWKRDENGIDQMERRGEEKDVRHKRERQVMSRGGKVGVGE